MRLSTISAIGRGIWLLDAGWVRENANVILAAMEGKATFDAIAGEQTALGAPANMESYQAAIAASMEGGRAYSISRPWQLSYLPEGSRNNVAVIKISGPILREGDCSMGLTDYGQTLRACEASDKIASIVLDINSPGGEASGTASFAQLIQNCSKPVVGMIDDGMAASAAMWFGSACKELYTTTNHSRVGSIGAYCTLADFAEAYDKAGIRLIEIYAPQSTEKNADYRAALDGDTTAIEEHLSELVDAFIGDVKAGRGSRLNAKAGNPFKGKMYSSKEAVKIGLIDGVRSPNDIFSRSLELSKKPTSTTKTKPMAQNKTYANIATAAGWEAGHESTEAGLHLNHEDAAAIDTALAAGTKATADLAAATAAGGTTTTDLATAQERIKTLETANEKLTSENAALGNKPAPPTNLASGQDEATESGKNAPVAMDETTAQAMRVFNRNNPAK